MGNTILAHALYACSQSKFEPGDIFSSEGNAHAIADFNQSNLIAWHGDMEQRDDIVPILHVTCRNWDEVLRIKLSYSKWFLDSPTENNFLKFGFNNPDNDNWLENLTTKYWTLLKIAKEMTSQPELALEDYISGNIVALSDAVEQIGWMWNQEKSNTFHYEMTLHNARYINWLTQIKTIVKACTDKSLINVDLEFWEQALVVAKVCDMKNISPALLHWNDYGCFLNKNNVTLIESLERI